MLTLRTSGINIEVANGSKSTRVFRLSTDHERPKPFRQGEGYIYRAGRLPEGFAWYVNLSGAPINVAGCGPTSSLVTLPPSFNYLEDGDIIRVGSAKGDVAVLFQRQARHHTFLLTERCNHFCLMCSQPPRDVQDQWIADDIMAAIPLIDRSTPEILFTGGEPTLLGPRLFDLVRQVKSYLPETGLHILTNGRSFSNNSFASDLAAISHSDLMLGIPIYSDQPHRHDYVVQANGAFDETIRGIMNLKRNGLRVEIRCVVHKQTYERLPQLARFIARNLTFVDQVVFMGLEMTGFTKANLADLWVDPIDYQTELQDAVLYLSDSLIHTSVYNHQLCVTPKPIWDFARQSISDWKNEYLPECEGCEVRQICGGFFSSAKLKRSDHIHPIMASKGLVDI